jgi:flagellar biogenesis protein FliO
VSPITDYLLQTATTLLAVAVLGALLVFGSRRLAPHSHPGPLELVGQLALNQRRSIYLVKVGERVFVLGGSEAGLAPLGEVPAASVPITERPSNRSFGQILQELRPRISPPEPKVEPATQAHPEQPSAVDGRSS